MNYAGGSPQGSRRWIRCTGGPFSAVIPAEGRPNRSGILSRSIRPYYAWVVGVLLPSNGATAHSHSIDETSQTITRNRAAYHCC